MFLPVDLQTAEFVVVVFPLFDSLVVNFEWHSEIVIKQKWKVIKLISDMIVKLTCGCVTN